MAEAWTVRRERSNRLFVGLIFWIARRIGRLPARAILHAVTLYYLVAAPGARRASRAYQEHLLNHRPGWRDTYKHFYCFATVALDRVYVFDDQLHRLQVRTSGQEVFHRHRNAGIGAIIMVAHLGSFEILRALAGAEGKLRLRILMDHAVGATANAMLDALDSSLSATIMDTSNSDVERAFKVHAALERGEMVGVMVDRYRAGERTADCRFFGELAPFPLSPWLLAALTRAPVLLAFGLFEGGNRYRLYLEQFAERLEAPRAQRLDLAAQWAQAYADRLAHYARKAPYNWFNFYDFWHT